MAYESPTQAVILAGGRGSRLRPLTDELPKPLIRFHGRPFLSYLLDQLTAQGIDEALVLIGYMADKVRKYYSGDRYPGLKISFVESPVEAETGQRLMDAASYLAPSFLMMYCDNYWPMQLTQMWQRFQNANTIAMFTVYANRDGYTRNNVFVDEQGLVARYDPERNSSDLNAVEIGYAILGREVLGYLPQGNVRFEHTVYPALASQGQLAAYVTEHRYYSVGSYERLPLTEAFLAPQRAVILDRDGVLNERPPVAHYVRNWDEFHWLPGALEAMKLLKNAGYQLLIASNQSGIARGVMTEDELSLLHGRLKQESAEAGAPIDGIYYCPHGWDDGCFCRKPSPGLLFQAQRDFHLDLTKTLFIGDDERDQMAGGSAGCPVAMVSPERSLLDVVRLFLAKDGAIAARP